MTYRAAFLPPLVRNLVCYDSAHSPPTPANNSIGEQLPHYVTSQGLLSVESIQPCLPSAVMAGPAVTEVDPKDLEPFKRVCLIVLSEVNGLAVSASPQYPSTAITAQDVAVVTATLKEIYAEQLNWLGQAGKRAGEIWLELFAKGQFDQAWLVGSTVLEQLVSNIIYTLQGPDKFIPFLVRDLLGVRCLSKCMDGTLIRVLKTMIGSPLTLNLRNLLWHGFILPEDDIPLDAYGAMFIVVTMTIASEAMAKLTGPLQIRHMNPKTFYFGQQHQDLGTDEERRDMNEAQCFEVMYETVAFGVSPPSIDATRLCEILRTLVPISSFVTQGSMPQWMSACQHLQRDSGSSFMFVMSTLPLIEHALRLIYVDVNQCKEDRKSALVAGEYYVTLDVVLDKKVPVEFYEPTSEVVAAHGPSGIPNKLFAELGAEIMNLVNDLFLLTYGPRLRDRTSHGELSTYLTIDVTREPWFAYYVGLVMFLLSKYAPSTAISRSMSSSTSSSSVAPCSSDLSDEIALHTSWITQYSACRFEERSALRKEALRCQILLAEYCRFVDTTKSSSHAKEGEHLQDSSPAVEIILTYKDAAVFSDAKAIMTQGSIEHLVRSSLSSWSLQHPISGDTLNSSSTSGSSSLTTMASNLPAWILIVQALQSAIQKVTNKTQALSGQLSRRELSSRSRKQFEGMQPMVPRLLGMLVGCLALVERFVLTPRSILVPLLDGLSIGSDSDPVRSRSTTPGTSAPGDHAQAKVVPDKSSASEIQLRLKMTTFVDKFVSNFERFKLEMIEPAWEDLMKSVEAVETRLAQQ